jgi:lysophospholipase L1-like esterase
MSAQVGPTVSRRWSLRALLAVGALGVAVALAEGALRLVGFSYMTFERPDPVRGVVLAPGAKGWQTREGRSYVSINKHGYRDRERDKTKPHGVYRIAVLGDSFVEARQVAIEDSFCALLEAMLNTAPPFGAKKVEVLNFGVAGYGTAQELLTLRQDVYDYAPDYVVLAFFPGNDIADNSKALSHPAETVPFFTLRGDELVEDPSFLTAPAFRDRYTWIARAFYATQERSRLIQLIYRARESAKVYGDRAALRSFSEPGLPNPVYREPSDAAWQQAWQVTERLIREMAGEVAQRGIAFGVVTVNTPIQANPHPSVRRQFTDRLGVDDLFYPDRRIKALGDAAGFRVLNLGRPFQEYAEENQVVLHGFENTNWGGGHWNEKGHRLAATMVAQWLAQVQ